MFHKSNPVGVFWHFAHSYKIKCDSTIPMQNAFFSKKIE